MPYIKQEKRSEVDTALASLIKHLESLPMEEQDGALNYAITKIFKRLYQKKYFHLNRALGVLSAVTHEFYRKVIGPYEETKTAENGDVGIK